MDVRLSIGGVTTRGGGVTTLGGAVDTCEGTVVENGGGVPAETEAMTVANGGGVMDPRVSGGGVRRWVMMGSWT